MENQIYEIEKVDVKQLETYMKENNLFPKNSILVLYFVQS